MPDEPKESRPPQEPKQPAPSIWETFAKGRVEKPRDIGEEESKSLRTPEIPKSIEEVRRELIEQFIHEIPTNSKSQSFQSIHKDPNIQIDYDVLLETDRLREQLLLTRVEYPRDDLEMQNQGRRIAFEFEGVTCPYEFEGPNGVTYSLLEVFYFFNLDDDTVYTEYTSDHSKLNRSKTIPKVEVLPPDFDKNSGFRRQGLSVPDFEFLGTVLHQIQSKELIPY